MSNQKPKQIKCYCGHTTMCDCGEQPKQENQPSCLGAVISRFSVGDTVNYCNGLIFKIVKINEECGTCYDSRGMWYALVNCVKLS